MSLRRRWHASVSRGLRSRARADAKVGRMGRRSGEANPAGQLVLEEAYERDSCCSDECRSETLRKGYYQGKSQVLLDRLGADRPAQGGRPGCGGDRSEWFCRARRSAGDAGSASFVATAHGGGGGRGPTARQRLIAEFHKGRVTPYVAMNLCRAARLGDRRSDDTACLQRSIFRVRWKVKSEMSAG
jgi:hypothetical protein